MVFVSGLVIRTKLTMNTMSVLVLFSFVVVVDVLGNEEF